MALRRPPTRVELKADDIDEYTRVMRQREMAMEDPVSAAAYGATGGGASDGAAKGPVGAARSVKWSPSSKKAAAAERIGIGQPR